LLHVEGKMGALARTLITVTVTLALASCTREPEAEPPQPDTASSALSTEFEGIATVADGDTLRVDGRRIRLHGIDDPRQGGLCGALNVYRAAAQELREATGNQVVRCTIADLPDGSGVHIARCRVHDTDLGEHMVSAGWARSRSGVYAEAEARARAAAVGVWAPNCAANLWDE
jgi:endonuclease YncB( thermonuclease family)